MTMWTVVRCITPVEGGKCGHTLPEHEYAEVLGDPEYCLRECECRQWTQGPEEEQYDPLKGGPDEQ